MRRFARLRKPPCELIRMDDCMLSRTGGNGGYTLSEVRQAFQEMSNALNQVLFMCGHIQKKDVYTSSSFCGVLHICENLCLLGCFRRQTRKTFCGSLKVATVYDGWWKDICGDTIVVGYHTAGHLAIADACRLPDCTGALMSVGIRAE